MSNLKRVVEMVWEVIFVGNLSRVNQEKNDTDVSERITQCRLSYTL